MVVEESNLEEEMQETTYEEEETLSLSDLPLYSHVEWEEEEEEEAAALSSSDQDYFEFSQELNPSALSPPETVVFCGKLIPYKQPSHVPDHDKVPSRAYEISGKKQVADHCKKNRGRGGSTRRMDQSKNGDRKDTRAQSSLHGSDFRLCKMSIVTSSPSGRARWYLFLFGIRSFSTKMELRDIRSRQNRRQYSSSPPPSPLLGDQVMSQGRSRGWGFWAVIRALSCGGNHQTETSVTPFIGCTTSPECMRGY